MSLKVYVEGGGDDKVLKSACRKGFRAFIEKAVTLGNMPKIVARGSRGDAFNSFRTSVTAKDEALLLIDAEGPVAAQGPWQHLKASDNWDRPSGASDNQCHLMVQAMESWFLGDREALGEYFGPRFQATALPQDANIERIAKQDVIDGLIRATRNTTKGPYKKGIQSYEILEKLDPAKVRRASPYADRLVRVLTS